MINRRPGGALYEQLAAQLREDITTGRLRPGQRLPSETTLQQQHGLARETVRRSIAILRNEGLVVVRRGHGVSVKEQRQLQVLTPPGGSTVTTRMPSSGERADHGIAEGVPVFVVTEPGGAAAIYPGDRWHLRLP